MDKNVPKFQFTCYDICIYQITYGLFGRQHQMVVIIMNLSILKKNRALYCDYCQVCQCVSLYESQVLLYDDKYFPMKI